MSSDREIVLTEAELKSIVSDAVTETFVKLGIDASKPIEMQRDFQHLREWRIATEKLQERGLLAIITIIVTGGCAALWLGFKGMLGH